ncbi:hypothetical protein FVE85_3423 [Porphyridium purpureum]|uniref:Uncharacterized protein n=1 Tax=Porphyridium purpureum TaxID=35688 RepID=A0A5J4YWG2_PORPP|nr:hypothetical protein FVE85_3423 [Porphyridium purpureum]|eukprot:POR6693..scf227_4
MEYVRWNNVNLRAEKTGGTARCHVNRLAVLGPSVRESALNPGVSGVFPGAMSVAQREIEIDTSDEKLRFLVRLEGNHLPAWMMGAQVPPIVLGLLKGEMERRRREDDDHQAGLARKKGREEKMLQALRDALLKDPADADLQRTVTERLRIGNGGVSGKVGGDWPT